MELRDVFLAAASLAAILVLALAAVFGAILVFTAGSPLVLLGSIMAMGLLGIAFLIGIGAALISLWYIIYAFLDEHTRTGKPAEPRKADYTLGRIRKSP